MYIPIDIHTWGDAWKAVVEDPEKWKELQKDAPGLPGKCPKYIGILWLGSSDLKALSDAGIDFNISKDELVSHTGSMIVRLQDQLMEKFGDGGRAKRTEQAVVDDCAVQISIPDIGLLLVDEVDYLSDHCTDMLQERLDEGWRILAVCPPNAQRRPDYIIGRRKRVS